MVGALSVVGARSLILVPETPITKAWTVDLHCCECVVLINELDNLIGTQKWVTSTKIRAQWTSIPACRSNFYILDKGPQTPCDRFGMMVWYGIVWKHIEMVWHGMVQWGTKPFKCFVMLECFSTLQCPSHSCRNPPESAGILRNGTLQNHLYMKYMY